MTPVQERVRNYFPDALRAEIFVVPAQAENQFSLGLLDSRLHGNDVVGKPGIYF